MPGFGAKADAVAQDGVLISSSSVPTVRFSWGRGEGLGGSRLILVAGSKCPATILLLFLPVASTVWAGEGGGFG